MNYKIKYYDYSLKIINLFFALVFITACKKTESANSNPSSVSLKSGLQTYYLFNSNANDESGNGNNGTIINASITKDRFNNINSAINFSGTNGYKVTTNYKGIISDQSRTIAFWSKISADFINHTSIINYGGDPNIGQQDFNIFISTLGGNGSPYIGVMLSNPGAYVGSYFSGLKDGKWHHYAFIHDNTNGSTLDKIKIYIDGILVSNNVSYYTPKIPTPVTINTYQNLSMVMGQYTSYNGTTSGSFRSFTGDLDDLGVWNRALSQLEISSLFNQSFLPK
jgi:hypothetical protein